MRRLIATISFLVLLALQAFAGENTIGYIPAADTTVVSSNVRLQFAHFNNTSGSAVTITITDRGTGCGGSGCQLWSAISIAANTSYEVELHGLPATNGFSWHASTGDAVVGYINWK